MNDLSPEQQEAIKDAPKGTFALMLLLAVLACVVLTNAYVAKADFEFGTPTNLGPAINTSMNELNPFTVRDSLSLGFVRFQADWAGVGELQIPPGTP